MKKSKSKRGFTGIYLSLGMNLIILILYSLCLVQLAWSQLPYIRIPIILEENPINSIFDISVLSASNTSVSLGSYRNAKCILIVNVASDCGYTYTNYKELVALYDKYNSKGLEILAFPSNNFGQKEKGTNQEIQQFAKNFGVTFPVFGKININSISGGEIHPLYKYLVKKTEGLAISWNFEKFLVVSGIPVARYRSGVSPKDIEEDILKYLSTKIVDEL